MTDPPIDKSSGSGFQLTVMWVLIAMFLLAMPMMFVHPGFVIASVWLGLIILVGAVVLWQLGGKLHLHR